MKLLILTFNIVTVLFPLSFSKPLDTAKKGVYDSTAFEEFGYPAKEVEYPGGSEEFGYEENILAKQAVPGRNKRWSKGVLPYVFDRKYSQADIKVIEEGMALISKVTCLTFKPRKNERDYIYFEDYGCAAYVGKTGEGKTTVWMSKAKEHYCLIPEVVAHEIIHAAGLHHEQQRPDRDDYIDVKWDNIDQSNPSWIHNIYEKMPDSWSTFGVAYDLDSIMHYPQGILAKNYSLPTMVSKIKGKEVPTRRLPDRLSLHDAEKLNKMYNNC